MKNIKILPYVVVPLLLITTFSIIYLAINKNWSFEITSYFIFLFSAAYILIFEQVLPLKPIWKVRKSDFWPEVKHFIFSTALFDALGKAAALSLVLYVQEHFFSPAGIWGQLPFIISFIIALLIGELFPYIYHKVSHTGNPNSMVSMFLWKIHSIHHLPESLNWFKTNWIHPINIFLNAVFKIAPLLILGFNDKVIFAVSVTHVVIAYISHANILTKTGFLDYIFVTPQVHHFHHSQKLEEAMNFGNIIPFWDFVFGTYYNRKGSVDKVGVIKGPILYPKHQNYIQQLGFPFRNMFKDCCNNLPASK